MSDGLRDETESPHTASSGRLRRPIRTTAMLCSTLLEHVFCLGAVATP